MSPRTQPDAAPPGRLPRRPRLEPSLATSHSPLTPAFLIGPPVIRICSKSPEFSHLRIPNRRKRHTPGKSFSASPVISANLCALCGETLGRFLIGPPVTDLEDTMKKRIRLKPFRISADSQSNRHETNSLAATGSAQILIETSGIRIGRKPNRINHIQNPNRDFLPLSQSLAAHDSPIKNSRLTAF